MRQFVALASLLFVVFSAVGLIKGLVAMTRSALEQLYDARFELSQAQLRAAQVRSVSAAATSKYEKDLSSLLMWEGPVSAGEARLQEVVSVELSTAKFMLEHLRAVPASPQGSLSKVAVDLSGVSSEASLYLLLERLEHHRPLVAIERIAVRSMDPAQVGTDISDGPQISVDMRVVAYGLQSPESRPSVQTAGVRGTPP